MSGPDSVVVTVRELNLIRKLLAAQASRIREDAPAIVRRQPHRLVREAMADIQEMAASNCDALAERLSFAAEMLPDATAVIAVQEVA